MLSIVALSAVLSRRFHLATDIGVLASKTTIIVKVGALSFHKTLTSSKAGANRKLLLQSGIGPLRKGTCGRNFLQALLFVQRRDIFRLVSLFRRKFLVQKEIFLLKGEVVKRSFS